MTLVIPNIFANDDIADATKINANYSACVASFNDLETTLGTGGGVSDSSADAAGSIMAYCGATAPDGWAICNGAELSKTTYAQLYARLGDTFATCTNTTTGSANSAPSSGNFRIPDLRSAFIRGVGTTNPNSVATTLGGYQADATAVNGLSNPTDTGSETHSHTQRYASAALTGGTWTVHVDETGDGATTITGGAHTHTIGAPTSTDVETRPYNIGLNWIIRLYDSPLYSAWVADKISDPTTTEGDILYRSNTTYLARLGRGTDGQVLTSTATTIEWADATGGGGVELVTTLSGETATEGRLVFDTVLHKLYIADGTNFKELIMADANIYTKYKLVTATTSVTRPSDTNIYAIGDAICNSTSSPVVFELDLSSLGAVNGQGIEIRRLTIASSVKQTVLPLINVYLSPATFTATNDNAALDIADATNEDGGTFITCDYQNFTASNSSVSAQNIQIPIVLASGDMSLFGAMQAANAYTPASAEKFTITALIALL